MRSRWYLAPSILGAIIGAALTTSLVALVDSQPHSRLRDDPRDAVTEFGTATSDSSTSSATATADVQDASPAPPGATSAAREMPRPQAEPSAATGTDAAASPRADVGVTDTDIRVAVTWTEAGSTARLGFSFNTGDAQSIYKAFIDEVNSNGGLRGRKLVATYRPHDPTNSASAPATCRSMTEDDKVFAVLGNHPEISCITREHDTLLISPNFPATEEQFGYSKGLLFTANARNERFLRGVARELHRNGNLKGKRIGIVDDTFLNVSVDRGFIPELRTLGYSVTERTTLSHDPGTAQSQIPVSVRTMKAKGVDLVFLGPNVIYAVQYVHAADSQAFTPAWVASDFAYLATDFTASNMPPSFDGSLGLTQLRTGEARQGMAEPELERSCREVAERRTRQRFDPSGTPYYTVQNACLTVRLFEAAVNAAGTNLTRDGVAAALEALGPVQLPYYGGTGLFMPGKHDAADALRPVRMNSECKCWLPVGDFRPMP